MRAWYALPDSVRRYAIGSTIAFLGSAVYRWVSSLETR